MFSVHVNWAQVGLHTVVPHLELSNKEYLALLVAVLGTTISPYLFFWQSAHRWNYALSRKVATGPCH